jgi:hypothetical protein
MRKAIAVLLFLGAMSARQICAQELPQCSDTKNLLASGFYEIKLASGEIDRKTYNDAEGLSLSFRHDQHVVG